MAKKPNGHAPEQSTINLRVLGALALYASKDESRHHLQGVCLEIERRSVTYIGTDGHRMLAYRQDLEPDEADHEVTGEFIVPTSHCKAWKLEKEEEGKAVLSESNAGRLTIARGSTDVTFMPIDGTYPNWRLALPRAAASGVPAQFNLKYLAEIAKVGKLLDLGQPFIGHNGHAPAFIWFSGHPNVMGIIMPVKAVDEMGREAPQWARRGPEREQTDIEDELFAEEQHDPETGELPPKPDKNQRAAEVAIKAFGKPVDLTEEEKAKGLTHAFEKDDGNRVAMSFPEGNRIGDAITKLIVEKYGRNAETLCATADIPDADPPQEDDASPSARAA